MVIHLATPREAVARFYEAVMEPKNDKRETRVLSSRDIFGDAKLVLIRHEDTTYRLMITRQGKLILNK